MDGESSEPVVGDRLRPDWTVAVPAMNPMREKAKDRNLNLKSDHQNYQLVDHWSFLGEDNEDFGCLMINFGERKSKDDWMTTERGRERDCREKDGRGERSHEA
ncbi:hypothetical protein RchiOBHm_Chr3g0471551 [Rosa chinensis]|uniref:Uncharacterized protein n=1 Tax=Rosa chinensis TaxID=74649 RepID=A0A2P6RBB9_ROSCH|nr:hypothetical protein RchiOBHm_Chr3g0471551 [Rosa chinensis]